MTSGLPICSSRSAQRASICSTSCSITVPSSVGRGTAAHHGPIPGPRLIPLLVTVLLWGCGGADTHGATVLHYAVHSRLVVRSLPQLAIKPAGAGAKPPLLVFLHGRGQHP